MSGTTIYGSTAVCSANGLLIGNGSVTATCNYLPKFTGTSTIGNSQIFDNGNQIGIGQTTLFTKFSAADSLAATSVGSNYNPGIVNIQNTNTTNGNLSLMGFQDASGFINLAAFGAINEVHSASPNNVKGSLGFYTKNNGTSYITEKMRIDASGNVGIGCTTPGQSLTVQSAGVATYLKSTATADSATYGNFQMYRQACKVGNGVGFALGLLNSAAVDTEYAYIGTLIESCTSTQECGAIGFYTTTAGNGRCERMRITSGGDVLMGYGNVGNLLIRQTTNGTVDNNSQSIGNNGINYMNRVSGTGLYHIFFNNGNNIVGTITSCTTATQFNTTSDYRLKTDLKNYNGICLINQIKTYDFAWKLNDARTYGVIAHELSDIIPYAVTGEKDALDERGCILPQAVDYSKIVTPLIKAVQEQQCTICSQASRITLLESCLGIA